MTVALVRDRSEVLGGALHSVGHPMGDGRVKIVVATHYAAVRRAMRRLGVTGADLDDVLQEIFLVFTRRMSDVAPPAERNFLLEVGFRVVRTRQRAYARRREELDENVDHIAPLGASPPSTPEEAMGQRERIELLDRLLSGMPVELREVLVLCDVEEATLEEAATILHLKVGTVGSRLSRARELFDKLALRARAAQTNRSR
jgi:RNA polymerase sigma-70 factor, ECF subfamily